MSGENGPPWITSRDYNLFKDEEYSEMPSARKNAA